MTDTPKGAILQRDGETYAIVPRTPVGLVNRETLEAITQVVQKYDIPIVKITSGQRLALVGMKADVIDDIWKDLGRTSGGPRSCAPTMPRPVRERPSASSASRIPSGWPWSWRRCTWTSTSRPR